MDRMAGLRMLAEKNKKTIIRC
eukprot:SAG31_NODE_27775_length_420_cov_0.947040_1_plen_21_part_10